MSGGKNRRWVILFLFLLLAASTGPMLDANSVSDDERILEPEWVRFDIKENVYHDAVGILDESLEHEQRESIAMGPFGTFDINGLQLNRPVPSEWMEPRFDLLMLLVSDEVRLNEVRTELSSINGLEVREFIAPSGLMVQGTPTALRNSEQVQGIAASHEVPKGMLVDSTLMDLLLMEGGEEALSSMLVRLEGWRNDDGPMERVILADNGNGVIDQHLGDVAHSGLEQARAWDDGRYEGFVQEGNLLTVMQQPSVMYLRPDPAFTAFNDNARGHMETNVMRTYFTTDLDGSGQVVAVADSGLDDDHGDFGSRVVGNFDVIGDGSTADKHSGHGTHVSCTVLGDGTRGGYSGVAGAADLYFQAMENDNTGNFQSPSLNNLLNTAYNADARTHTNSWGSSSASQQGKYNSETEDVDDRASYYDRYYTGREGLTILFAAGNDGPDSGTVSPPATAKNVVSVGNHQNRYNGAPDTIMQGSSRGPTDDGRIKPDLIAPGGYVRSCRAQEATDVGGSSWSNSYYLEYTGTSMATPNAAGMALMIREYLEEIAQRPSPQGALVKALLVLGAEDVGSRNIPNDDEGWGRINLRNTLAPRTGQGIWVDDRSILSGTGNSKTYSFNVSQASGLFKAVLTWSDERGSRFSNSQLVNDLDLIVTSPDGTVYLGNDFANGRSTTGGSRDTVNNLEVILIDSAATGTWTVKVQDGQHSGSKTQPYAVAVLGHGVNDLRPDPMMQPDEFEMNVGIPQVGDPVQLTTSVFNFGNVVANTFPVVFEVDGTEISRQSTALGAGSTKKMVWSWTPQSAGTSVLSFIIDPDDTIEEIRENNNRHDITVNITAPGVKLESPSATMTLTESNITTTSWNLTLTNTALISTNASMQTGQVVNSANGQSLPWYIGSTTSNFSLEGQESQFITVTLVHPAPPLPGDYRIDLLGLDVDNSVTYPFELSFIVPDLANADLEYDYSIVPVHPSDPTNLTVRFFNNGNAAIGYDLFLEPPTGWRAGFSNLGSEGGALSGSTGLIDSGSYRSVDLVFTPPLVLTAAGAERIVELIAISQTELQKTVVFEIPIKVETVRDVYIHLESSYSKLSPNSTLSLLYSVEHNGNIDLELTPSFTLPPGWSITSVIESVNLPWGGSNVLLYTLQGNGAAKSGSFEFILESPNDRFSWSGDLVVETLAAPSLTFAGLELSDGTTFSTPQASGSHPTGEAMEFTWLVTNEATTPWSPSVSLQTDSGLFGDCTFSETVELSQFVPVTCSILIANGALPFAEPSFTLTLEGEGVTLTKTVGLLVGENEVAGWSVGSVPEFKTGDDEQVVIEITNLGNTRFERQVRVNAGDGWAGSIDGSDIIELEVGQSTLVRLDLRADQPGETTVTLSLVGSEDSSATFSFPATSKGEPVGSSLTSGLSSTSTLLGLVVLLAILGAFGIIVQRRNPGPQNEPMLPTKTHPGYGVPQPTVTAPPAPAVAATPAPICWSCREPVIGPTRGCPACGARYHGIAHGGCEATQLAQCVNCSGSSEHFVQA